MSFSNQSQNTPYHQAHQQAIQDGAHYYTDPQTGFLVFTELYHLARGVCCQNTCRHCPYGFNASLQGKQSCNPPDSQTN